VLAAPLGSSEVSVVTGAFSYTGSYIASRLLATGKRVRVLTGHPNRPNPFGDGVGVASLDFGHPSELTRSLRGAATLYNTYWVRFAHGEVNFDTAIRNTETLIKAAKDAGVRRIVHLSVSNPSLDSPLPYFRGKATVEKMITQSGLSYAIIRPTVIFGVGDILINNIAWLLRRLPVFAIPGTGEYRLQPISVEDVAEIAIGEGSSAENTIVDAAGPDTFTFTELVRLVAWKVGSKARLVHLPPNLALLLAGLVGRLVRDVLLTRDELDGLMANLLISDNPPIGRTRLSDWLDEHTDRLGVEYASELNRHYRT